MTVTVNATGTKAYSGSTLVTSYNYTGLTIAAGSNTALTVAISWDIGLASASPTGITAVWDSGGSSQSMTKLAEIFWNGTNSTTGPGVTLFGLRNPTTGNKTLALSWTNSARAFVVGMGWDGVDTSSDGAAFPHTGTQVGNNTTGTIAITSATGNKVTLGGESPSQSFAGITGTTIYSDGSSGTIIWAWANYDNGAATVNIGNTNIQQTMAATDIAAFVGAAANPNNQFNWPVPQAPDYPLFLRTWISEPQSPFPPFTAPVLMPPLIVDWGISDRRTFEPARIQYNATLLAQPAATYMPGRVLDWGTVPAASTTPALTWTQRPQLTAVAVGPLPKNQYDWPIPTAPRPAADLRTFINDLPIQLIGKDKLPVRQRDWPVPPSPRPASDLRTFINDSPIQLIGKDKLPIRQQIWPVPTAPDYSVSLRSFLASPGLPLISAPVQPPFSQDDWPLPIAAIQPIRTWTQSPTIATPVVAPTFMPGRVSEWGMWQSVPFTPANLLAKNIALQPTAVVALPKNQYNWPLPQSAPSFSAAPITNLTLSLPEAVAVEYVFRAPNYTPQWPGTRFETWTTSVNIALRAVPPPPRPFTQIDWPLTPAARQPDRTYQRAFPPELVGQDRLPFRQQSWPLTPATEFSNALRSIGFRSPALDVVVAAPTRPFVQTDWPVPAAARQPDRTYQRAFPPELIGKDRLPIRQQDWPLPIAPRPAADLRTYIAQSPIRLIGKDRLPFRQMHWPVPRAHLEFHTLRSITQGRVIYGGEVAPIPPEPPLPPPEVIHSVRAHADAYYGVFYADEIKGRADFSRAKGSNDEEAAN